MELYLSPSFDTVYLINGAFSEKPRKLVISEREANYITVLPLSGALLPYTVKLTGAKVASNENLCSLISTPAGLILRLSPRYNYVYSCSQPGFSPEAGVVPAFFYAVTAADYEKARQYLTSSLSQSVDDGALSSFFEDYSDILSADAVTGRENAYFLIDGQNKASLFLFTVKGGLIDDIIEG